MNYLAATIVNETACSRRRRGVRLIRPGEKRAGEVSHRNSGNGRCGCFALSLSLSIYIYIYISAKTSEERDSTVFGFIIAYLGRPRRIIAHEDSTRTKIYGWPRCNSPTETDRRSQINFG